MTNMFDPTKSNIFGAAANAANQVFKLKKQEEAKGARAGKVGKAIQEFHLAHQAVKEEIAKALSEDLGQDIKPNSDMVNNAVFSLKAMILNHFKLKKQLRISSAKVADYKCHRRTS